MKKLFQTCLLLLGIISVFLIPSPSASAESDTHDLYYPEIVEIAMDEIGQGADSEMRCKYNNYKSEMWCADFVAWCGIQAGLGGGIYPSWYTPVSVWKIDQWMRGCGFQAYSGTQVQQFTEEEKDYYAVPGDLFLWGMNHIGIIVDVTDESLIIVDGNALPYVRCVEWDVEGMATELGCYYGLSLANAEIIHVVYPGTPDWANKELGDAKKHRRTDKEAAHAKAAFSSEYGWDPDAINADTWTGKDGETYERDHGHQWEEFDDMLQEELQHALALGIISTLGEGGGGGMDIVAVALGEVGVTESPPGSNNVKYNTWRYGRTVSGDKYMWCANFVAWCANECGYIDSGLFNMSENVKGVYDYQTGTNGFDAYSAHDIRQLGGNEYDAKPGDIFCFGFSHIGIVTSVDDDGIEITQGNTADSVMTIRYSRSSLYSSLSSGIIIAMEYPNDAWAVYYFVTREMGLSAAAAAGICANIEHESNFNPNALGDSGTSYGICQWHNERWSRLRDFCDSEGYDWETMDGQLRYLEYELTYYYGDVYTLLQTVDDSESGAYTAGYRWCFDFERPADTATKSDIRGELAKSYYYTFASRS